MEKSAAENGEKREREREKIFLFLEAYVLRMVGGMQMNYLWTVGLNST